MNFVENKFKDIAIIRNGIMLFSKVNSILIIKKCKEANILILGLDGFTLFDNKIQPNIEYSIDFSATNYLRIEEDFYLDAINFIISKSDNIYYEIICDD